MFRVVGSALGVIVKGGLTLGARVFIPISWPFLRLTSIGAIPVISHGLPLPAQSLAISIGRPVGILLLLEGYLKWRKPLVIRRLRLWQRMLPIYCMYVKTEKRIMKQLSSGEITEAEAEKQWDARHEWGAEQVYSMVLEANGYIVKVAQVIASKPDVVPRQWIEKLSQLFDSMPPRPWPEVELAIEREVLRSPLGQDLGERILKEHPFEVVAQDSIASASVAQVHCATLSENVSKKLGNRWKPGDQVVVKIQHDMVKGLMHVDLNNVELMGKFLKNVLPFKVAPIVQEMRRAIPLEFNFLREARLAKAIKTRLASSEFGDLLVPESVMELCTDRMLVLEYMEGRPFSKLLPVASEDPVLLKQMQDGIRMIVKAYGHMIIHDGLFHGDPHPGNILLRSDGRLVLLDFGQCKAFRFQRQMALARLVIAMKQGNAVAIVVAMSQLGLHFKGIKRGVEVKPQDVVTMAFLMFDTKYMPEALVNPFGCAEDHLLSSISIEDFPPDLWLVVRVMMILRGLCHDLGVDVQAVDLWEPYARAVLKDEENARKRSIENHMLDVGEIEVVENEVEDAIEIPEVDLGSILDDIWTCGAPQNPISFS
ncbi:hypothetical protein BSKO_03819 [Bryopsis sp. KO-2023]|nr:hypothetical protein BSKO_03819 [Bryopsis sp. KO-2023]